MTCNPTPVEFKDIYLDKLELGDKVSRELKPLHEVCLHSKDCWSGLSTACHQEDERAKIYHPYIGEKYQDLKLLCLGINMNNHGGFDSCDDLAKEACNEMEEYGRTKVRFGNDYNEYSGTYLYHRMGVYSKIIAEAFGISAPLTHINAFDFIAYTNHIKCSPVNDERSKPTNNMWDHCGEFILKEELKILQPNILLVLGKSDNYWWLAEKAFDKGSTKITHRLGRISLAEARLGGRNLKVIVMPHPSSNSGIAKKLQSDLQEILSSNPSFL